MVTASFSPGRAPTSETVNEPLPRVTRTEIIEARQVIEEQVYLSQEIREALVDIAQRTRNDERALQGVSTRSLVLAVPALQARALCEERDYVSSEDVEALAARIFAHRLEVAPGAESAEVIVQECLRAPLESLARATLRR